MRCDVGCPKNNPTSNQLPHGDNKVIYYFIAQLLLVLHNVRLLFILSTHTVTIDPLCKHSILGGIMLHCLLCRTSCFLCFFCVFSFHAHPLLFFREFLSLVFLLKNLKKRLISVLNLWSVHSYILFRKLKCSSSWLQFVFLDWWGFFFVRSFLFLSNSFVTFTSILFPSTTFSSRQQLVTQSPLPPLLQLCPLSCP